MLFGIYACCGTDRRGQLISSMNNEALEILQVDQSSPHQSFDLCSISIAEHFHHMNCILLNCQRSYKSIFDIVQRVGVTAEAIEEPRLSLAELILWGMSTFYEHVLHTTMARSTTFPNSLQLFPTIRCTGRQYAEPQSA